MDFLNEIGLYGEAASSSSSASADAFRKFSELTQNVPYRLSCIELINTKFGNKLALKLVDVTGIFFLPSRFQNLSQERKSEMLTTLNESADVTVFYRGERKFGAYKNSTPLIEFSFVHPSTSSSSSSSTVDTGIAAVALEGKRERNEEEEGVEEKPKKKKKKHSSSANDF